MWRAGAPKYERSASEALRYALFIYGTRVIGVKVVRADEVAGRACVSSARVQ